jgi:hypothetical protein
MQCSSMSPVLVDNASTRFQLEDELFLQAGRDVMSGSALGPLVGARPVSGLIIYLYISLK